MPDAEGRGLFAKFVVHRRLDRDVLDFDPGAPVPYPVFVLRIDGEDPAALEALRTYCMATDDADLAYDLAQHLQTVGAYEAPWATIFSRHGTPDERAHNGAVSE